MFARVAIPIPSPKTFLYAIPPKLEASAATGKRAVVPFGAKSLTGWITGLFTEAGGVEKIRDILDIPDAEALFSDAELSFFEWIADYYLHPLGLVLAEALPGGINASSRSLFRLAAGWSVEGKKLSPAQESIMKALSVRPKGLSLPALARVIKEENLREEMTVLEKEGIVVSEEILSRAPLAPKQEKWIRIAPALPEGVSLTEKQQSLLSLLTEIKEVPLSSLDERFRSLVFLRGMESRGILTIYQKEIFREYLHAEERPESFGPLTLNSDQASALTEIMNGLASRRFSPYLLHGVTGSGKTEIYLRAIEQVLGENGSAIYLVPEIALTTHLIRRVKSRFPEEKIAVIHSGIPNSIRYDQWRQIKSGTIRLIVGARSAIFAPAQNLRLIVVDEEHDPSYKQDDRLHYNGRDLSLVRGKSAGAAVILGSATPGIQTYYYAQSGVYRLLSLPSRVNARPLPKVEVVDMRNERDSGGRMPIFSRRLLDALGETLSRKKQALIFLNRRGFHTYVFCADCGRVFNCPACDLAMTYHASQNVLKCHHCDFTVIKPQTCPACGSERIRSQGTGTERIEEELQRFFPAAVIARIDSDTSSRRGASEKTLADFADGAIDILVGTQIITKGLDFPGITLVGVIAADASLNVPDFRAAERTFQIISQVSGRGGRGDHPGLVVIQTFTPWHHAIRQAQQHDYAGFYKKELPSRRELNYPPFARLMGIHFSSLNRDRGAKIVADIGKTARNLASEFADGKADVIGPAESPLPRLRGRYRWQMLLRSRDGALLHAFARKLLDEVKGEGLEIRLDVDPVHFM